MDMDIKVGDRVRSFDFDLFSNNRDLTGERACFVEGTVIDFQMVEGCMRYVIRVERRIFAGEPFEDAEDLVYPPINGTRVAGSDWLTKGVEKL